MRVEEKLREQLERIRQENDTYGAFLHVRDEQTLLAEAREADTRIREGSARVLEGMTLGVKATISVEGLPVSAASRVLEAYVGSFTADAVERLTEAGVIITGMTNCDEFAAGGSGLHSQLKPVRNAIHPDHIPGGSSSGSAVAVARGMVDAALGTDTGGSIRNPASRNGLVGVKPSYGRVSRHGLLDLAMSLDQIGPITRTVRDAARILQQIAGRSEHDARTRHIPVPDYEAAMRKPLPRIAIARVDHLLHPLVKSWWDGIVERVERLLGELPRVDLPLIDLAVATYYPLVYVEFYSATRRYTGRLYGRRIEEAAGEEVLRRIEAGRLISREEDEHQFYRKALRVMEDMRKAYEALFQRIDGILLPTLPVPTRRLDEPATPEEEYAEDALTIPANLAGLAAGVVPGGTVKGLPMGVQVYVKPFNEEALFTILAWLEAHVSHA